MKPRQISHTQLQDSKLFPRGVRVTKTLHVAQMLGNINGAGTYTITSDLADALIQLPKVPRDAENEIEGYTNCMHFSTPDGDAEFVVEFFDIVADGDVVQRRAVLNLLESAYEMGGMTAATYLTPLTTFDAMDVEGFTEKMSQQFNLHIDAFVNEDDKWLDWLGSEITVPQDTASRLRDTRAKKKVIADKLFAEIERLSQRVLKATKDYLATAKGASLNCAKVCKDFETLSAEGKRFMRRGKPDFHLSTVQTLSHSIEKNGLEKHPDLYLVVHAISELDKKVERVSCKHMAREPEEVFTAKSEGESLSPASSPEVIKNAKDRIALQKATTEKGFVAALSKLSPADQKAVISAKSNFGDAIGAVLGNKTKGNPNLTAVSGRLRPNRAKARADFAKVYREKSKKVQMIYHATEEVLENSDLEKMDAPVVPVDEQIAENKIQAIGNGTQQQPSPEQTKLQGLVQSLVEEYKSAGSAAQKQTIQKKLSHAQEQIHNTQHDVEVTQPQEANKADSVSIQKATSFTIKKPLEEIVLSDDDITRL
jgi:hypothetical protein